MAACGAECAVHAGLLDELWRASGAGAWGLRREEFDSILTTAGLTANFGLAAGEQADRQRQREFFLGLRLDDLVLAQACAQGNQQAWEQFLALHREPLRRAAIAIAGNASLGRDLADQLWAELYGLNERDGERVSPLGSYRGRGSLMGWLRTVLAQRHVDQWRRTGREETLEGVDPIAREAEDAPASEDITTLENAVGDALGNCAPEERYLLAAYYLDGQTLAEVAQVLSVHEATVSRRLQRTVKGIRKQVLRGLERQGMSPRRARESLGTDPRDLDLNLKKLLQQTESGAFKE
jgi:RNA polymerase sigma-70 factor (ECF subfamily)